MLLKLILCASCLLFSSHAFAVNYGVLFLDKSTSMNSKRQDGRSRCDVSKDIAKKSVKNFFEKWNGRQIDIRVFSESGDSKSITEGYTNNKSKAIDAIDSLPQDHCVGNATALAQSLCEAADQIRATFGADLRPGRDHLLVAAATDGEENDSEGECSGDTWQDSVKEKFLNESPEIKLNMNFFGKLARVRPGNSSSPTRAEIHARSLEFFTKLSQESGGVPTFINDYSSSLPDFIPIFPNDDDFRNVMDEANVNLSPWEDTVLDDSLGFNGLLVDRVSYDKTLDYIEGRDTLRDTNIIREILNARPKPDTTRPDIIRPDIIRPDIVRDDIFNRDDLINRPDLINPIGDFDLGDLGNLGNLGDFGPTL